jgi:hypothetical protein
MFALAFMSGCAATGGEDYAPGFEREYKDIRLVQKQDAGGGVGTLAAREEAWQRARHS